MIEWKTFRGHIPGSRWVSFIRNNLRAQWFDWRYRVKTRGDEDPYKLVVVGGNVSHALPYIPTTARIGRQLLRVLPIADVSSYTFIDMGSCKGRMLFLAAELPFCRVIGIEFSSDLHAIASNNVKTYRSRKRACFEIKPVHMDATEYRFPLEPLVVYFFFPFDRPVMEPVIQNLNRSIVKHPRDVVLVYHNPLRPCGGGEPLEGLRSRQLPKKLLCSLPEYRVKRGATASWKILLGEAAASISTAQSGWPWTGRLGKRYCGASFFDRV